jgi:RNA polymerase sigma-54 factor
MATGLQIDTRITGTIKLSPAQIQVMKMLEVPGCELQARIDEELQKNPALEEGLDKTQDNDEPDAEAIDDPYDNPLQNSDFDYDDYVQDDDATERNSSTQRTERTREEIPFSEGTSFGEHLKSQIYLTKMDKFDRHIAKFVVGNIDDNGYLRRTAEELVDDLSFREGITISDAKMQDIIAQVQQFDPPGVAAYDLQECLLIQLRQKEQTASIHLATTILTRYFDIFSRKQYTKLAQRLNISEEQLKVAISEITRLTPRPGNNWLGTVYDRNQSIVTPDFIVEEDDYGKLVVSLVQGDIPPLRVSAEYDKLNEQYAKEEKLRPTDRETAQFVKNHVNEAKWFIDALRQRNQTLMQTMRAIVEFQREFFLHGDSSNLKPMVLKDIADKVGLDQSTISRVCSNKYVQTQYGIFSLKHFFTEAIQTSDGGEISNLEIKEKLREIIDQEDKRHPITDDELVQLLHESGYNIARRTVAKYREKLGIPVARLRHQL